MSINIFMEQFVPQYLKHQYNLYDRTHKTGIKHYCNFPYKVITIGPGGDCFLCQCDGWLPISVGRITDFKDLHEVWNTTLAIKLQKDISSKKFTYCSVDSCNIKKQDVILDRFFIGLNFDESCNLACPTCRKSKINNITGEKFDKKIKIAEHISKLISNFKQPLDIKLSGNGDPFASLIYRNILMNTVPDPNHNYYLLTNGLLLKKLLLKTKIYPQIVSIDISVDAGDKETYEQVRLGGEWKVLIENLDFLKTLEKKIRVNLNMVVHKNNMSSILNFVSLVTKYNWTGRISKIENWGTFDTKKWQEQNVFDLNHPNYAETKQIINSIKPYKESNIFVGSIYN
jgi:MoaA/NifB/PqqE/SkfB family radical SAM enzyme